MFAPQPVVVFVPVPVAGSNPWRRCAGKPARIAPGREPRQGVPWKRDIPRPDGERLREDVRRYREAVRRQADDLKAAGAAALAA
jgi:hypothetical protein